MRGQDWVGRRIGDLTVISYDGLKRFLSGGKASIFTFRCACGRKFQAQKSNVTARGNCGCAYRKTGRTAQSNYTAHPLHKVWAAMIYRCTRPSAKSFEDYGGRGIKVCDRWMTGDGNLTGFECFVRDMGERPSGQITIERVDNDGDYGPENCIWIKKSDQSRNRRGVHLVTIGGVTKTVPEWAAANGLSYWTAIRRIQRGWPPEHAVAAPLERSKAA